MRLARIQPPVFDQRQLAYTFGLWHDWVHRWHTDPR
jgi:hypothetical protein